jgi:hypothetical protein
MAKKDHPNRFAALAAKIESPQVVAEIDKVLNEMRQDWLDLMDLRKSAVRRHGDRGLAAPLFPMDEAREATVVIADPPKSLPAWTLAKLTERYKHDLNSSYQKISYNSRTNYDAILNLILREHASVALSDINARVLLEWHSAWGEGGKIAVAHAKIGMLRRMFGFGAATLEDAECLRLATVLHTMRFKIPRRRKEQLTAEQATAIRAKAHERERPSLALAQAFQFDLGLSQKMTIGEWVPKEEAGESDIVWEGYKWLRGIRWSDIDDNMVLNFSTPGQDAPLIVNLRQAPMVMEELKSKFGFNGNRSSLPRTGAIIISEHSERPWEPAEFRRWWRMLADACGIPSTVRNMDSRPKIGRRPSQDYDEDEELESFADGNELSSLH